MGSKLSSLSCASCKGDRYDSHTYRGSRYKSRSFRQHRRRSGSGHCRYDESVYEATAAPTVYMNRIERRNRRTETEKNNPQPSVNLARLSEELFVVPRDQHPPNRLANIAPSNALEDGEEASDTRRYGADLYKDGPSKNVGSSIEILDCPDMSTISMRTPQNNQTPTKINLASDVACTPVEAKRIDDVIFESRVSQSDVTATTLTVPPNSLNSQFISGITPLESIREDEFRHDSSTDSVFSHEGQRLFSDKYLNPNMQRPPPSLLLNNNNILCLPHGGAPEHSQQSNTLSVQADASDGPGFDSDFGASAGVEMRIVSSDYSTPQRKMSAVKRWRIAKSSSKKRKLRKEFLEINGREVNGASSNSFMSRNLHYDGRPDRFLHPLRSYHRRATISGSEASAAHVTMEWDPYDTAYGSAHWMEYIIPGVTYPSHPLLCDEQYWL